MIKAKEVMKLLNEIEKEKGDIVIFKTYYHSVYLSDITKELENVLVKMNHLAIGVISMNKSSKKDLQKAIDKVNEAKKLLKETYEIIEESSEEEQENLDIIAERPQSDGTVKKMEKVVKVIDELLNANDYFEEILSNIDEAIICIKKAQG